MSVAFFPTTSLAALKRGEAGVVHQVDGSPEFVRRMAEMGICTGGLLEVIEPGSPCRLAVGTARIVLRAEQLSAIRVSPLS